MRERRSAAAAKAAEQQPEEQLLAFEEEAPVEDAPQTGSEAPESDEGTSAPEAPPQKTQQRLALPPARAGGAPGWAKVPKDMIFPRGRQIVFLRFRPEWTDTPQKGERQAILWSLTDADEKMAAQRAREFDANRAMSELAKQMVRAVDGHRADWSGAPGPGNIDAWWNDVGGKIRNRIVALYTRMHMLNDDELRDFFESCIEVRTSG
jgi:hypothetical protein